MELHLNNNHIRDLTPLYGMINLQIDSENGLRLADNSVSQREINRLIAHLRGEELAPRPRSEWTLFFNDAETDIYISFNKNNRLSVPIKEAAILLGAERIEYSYDEGYEMLTITKNGMISIWSAEYVIGLEESGELDGENFYSIVDGIVYMCFMTFNSMFRIYHNFTFFHRVDVKNKILYIDEQEKQWVMYINGQSPGFQYRSTWGQYFYWEDIFILYDDYGFDLNDLGVAQNLQFSLIDYFRYIGAEFVHNPQPGGPNYHDVVWNGEVIFGYWNPDGPQHISDSQTHIPWLEVFGFTYTFNVDFANRVVYFVSDFD